MQSTTDLSKLLFKIDGKGYKGYKSIAGSYKFPQFELYCDYIQGDPFASPSRVRVKVPQSIAKFPKEFFGTKTKKIALQDFLNRKVDAAIKSTVKGNRGTGKSGLIMIDNPKQQIFERTALVVTANYVEARISIGLPAQGRKILGQQANIMLTDELPKVVQKSLFKEILSDSELLRHIQLAVDQEYIRSQLKEKDLVCFIANGAILPRKSGISDLPLRGPEVIPFKSPSNLEVPFRTPHNGVLKGMGIPKGVSLIVGGGYHGKSTLLQAIERGIYNHIAEDGREFVITDPSAVKIRAEDGRQVSNVNISLFINNLPNKQDTTDFFSEDASGSTSQATNIMEALETGSKVLLVDEDTSATNFMIRDFLMQKLIAKENEPITPYIDRISELSAKHGISNILVVGGSGDYFHVADLVIAMEEYKPHDVTNKAQQIIANHPITREEKKISGKNLELKRFPLTSSFDATSRGKKTKIAAKGLHSLQYGNTFIDLSNIEQLVDTSQTRMIGDFIHYCAKKYVDGKHSLAEIISLALKDIEQYGLDVISPFYGKHPGDYCQVRKHELAAAINRMRTLKFNK